jgi:hypothetical protein
MISMLNDDRYRLLQNLQYLQEQDEINKKKEYKAALAKKDGKENFTYNKETIPVKDYLYTDPEADAVIDKNEKQVSELNNIDNFVKELDERKKRRKKKRKSKKPAPNKYQRKKYKARSGTRRGDTMARLSSKIKKGKKLTKADYKARDDSETAERKKKGYISKQRFDTGMYLSETKKRELDTFVEMLDERKKRKKRKKSTKKKKKSSAGGLSAATKETLKKKAKKRGLTPGSVYAEYRKGLAAYYSSGSRKGMSAHQWAHARVNSANPSKSWAVVKKSKSKKK